MVGRNGSGLGAISIRPVQLMSLEATCSRSFLPTGASEPFTRKDRTLTTGCRKLWPNGTVRTTPIGDAYNYTPRGFITGPGNWNSDISLFKWFDISESVKLRFTADFFNAFNHPVDIQPNFTTGLQDLSQQLNEPRIIQLSLRLNW
jgi:hypothetical protein